MSSKVDRRQKPTREIYRPPKSRTSPNNKEQSSTPPSTSSKNISTMNGRGDEERRNAEQYETNHGGYRNGRNRNSYFNDAQRRNSGDFYHQQNNANERKLSTASSASNDVRSSNDVRNSSSFTPNEGRNYDDFRHQHKNSNDYRNSPTTYDRPKSVGDHRRGGGATTNNENNANEFRRNEDQRRNSARKYSKQQHAPRLPKTYEESESSEIELSSTMVIKSKKAKEPETGEEVKFWNKF